MNFDMLIDEFVRVINASEKPDLWHGDTPLSIVDGEGSNPDNVRWSIKPYNDTFWVPLVEEKLRFKIPPLYRSLVARYIFPNFSIDDIRLLANTPEGTAEMEFRDMLFFSGMTGTLIENGYLQFANPDADSFDPVCFDMNRLVGHDDHPIIQIDHNGILISRKIDIVGEMLGSFEILVRAVIEGRAKLS